MTAGITGGRPAGHFALYPNASRVVLTVGRNAAGKLLVYHRSSGMNNVRATGFTTFAQPNIFDIRHRLN